MVILWADLVDSGPTQVRIVGSHPEQHDLLGCIVSDEISGGRAVSFKKDGMNLVARAIWLPPDRVRRTTPPASMLVLGPLAEIEITESLANIFGKLEAAMETASSGAEESNLDLRVSAMEKSGKALQNTLASQSTLLRQVMQEMGKGKGDSGAAASTGAGGRQRSAASSSRVGSSSASLLGGLRERTDLF